jgi:hypothetical protein
MLYHGHSFVFRFEALEGDNHPFSGLEVRRAVVVAAVVVVVESWLCRVLRQQRVLWVSTLLGH